MTRTTPVLVVGAGPTGLVAALTLARHQVPVLLVDRRPEICRLSRALVLSLRSMELLRSFGLEDAVRAVAADVEPLGWAAPSLAAAPTVGVPVSLGHPGDAESATLSPTRPAWVSQDQVEPLLLAALRRSAGVEIRFGSELVSLDQDGPGVRAGLREAGRVREIRARYVIGADGGRGVTRPLLGVGVTGPGELGEHETVDFRAPLAHLLGPRPYSFVVLTGEQAPGILARRGPGDLWHYGLPVRPGRPRLADLPPDRLAGLVAAAAGVPGLRPDIVHTGSYGFGAALADRYRVGRVFLAGDAAHRMTPRGGTGMNTAIQDAYDLGWKLGWVLRGWAGPDLLDTYARERRPVAAHNVRRSADPGGVRRLAPEAVSWDLAGRLPHRRLRHEGRLLSTLDLLTDGFTLFTGPSGPGQKAADALATDVPVTVRTVDADAARAIGVPEGGVLLVRPDGRRHRHWAADATGWSEHRLTA